jgi:DNA-binding PadR family transcriptional regulator
MVKVNDAFLRGLERPVMLWLLSRKPRHGYELILEFKRLTGRKLKPAMVYPFLRKLEKGGFAVSEWVKKGKRKLRYYSLTKRGEGLLRKVRGIFSNSLKEVLMDLIDQRKT